MKFKIILTSCIFLSFTCLAQQHAENKDLAEQGNYLKLAHNVQSLPLTSANSERELFFLSRVYFENQNIKGLNDLKSQIISAGYDTTSYFPYQRISMYYYLLNGALEKAEKAAVFNLNRLSPSAKSAEYLFYLQKLLEVELLMQKPVLSEKLSHAFLTKVEDIYTKRDKPYKEALLLKAESSLLKSDLKSALGYLEEVEMISKEENSTSSLEYAKSLLLQAEVYFKKGEFTVVHTYLKNSAAILSQLLPEGHWTRIKHLHLSAKLAGSLKNYGRENEHLQNTKELILQNYPHPQSQPLFFKTDLLIGQLYSNVFDPTDANDFLKKITVPEYLNYSSADLNLLEAFKAKTSTKNTFKAELALRQSADSIAKYFGYQNYNLAEIYLLWGDKAYEAGKYRSAIDSYKKAANTVKYYGTPSHNHYLKAQSQIALASWAAKDNKKALKYFLEAGDNYTAQFNKVFSFLGEREKNLYYEEVRSFFDKFNAFVLDYYKHNNDVAGYAYNYRLSTKAILFTSTQELRNTVKYSGDKKLIDRYKQWNTIRENLAKAYKLQSEGVKIDIALIEELEDKVNELEEFIQLKASVLNAKKGNFKKSITWVDLQMYEKRKEALIEIMRIPGFEPDSGGTSNPQVHYAALVITKKTKRNPELIMIEDGNQLEERDIKYYHNAIKIQVPDEESYSRFLEPIVDYLDSDIKNIYFSPDGVYNLVNLNTMYIPSEEKYVLDKYNIKLLTGTRDFYYSRSEGRKKDDILPEKSTLVGFPDYYHSTIEGLGLQEKKSENSGTRDISRSYIAALPGSKAEVEIITEILEDHKTEHYSTVYMDMDATEENIKNIRNSGIVHIATHGFFNESKKEGAVIAKDAIQDVYTENPLLLCGILLTGAGHAYNEKVLEQDLKALQEGKKHEDGILFAYEAMNMDLDGSKLAILSACETGLGEVKNGEGIYGFQRSLQTAGAKVIIMSLWKVDDAATQKLMTSFYKHWREGNDMQNAFLQAQKDIKQEFSDPKYWGAFIMIGI